MNIAPAHGKPQPAPSAETSRRGLEPRERELAFEEILATALSSTSMMQSPGHDKAMTTAAHEMPIVTLPGGAASDCPLALKGSTQVLIGEDAVRFEARPIVGPSAIPEALDEPTPIREELLPPTAANFESVSYEREFLDAVASVAPQLAAITNGHIVWTLSAPQPSIPARMPKGGAPQSIDRHAPFATVRTQRTSDASARTPVQAFEGAKSESRTDISLTLLADEVLVTVRGLDLSADEELALSDEVGRLLALSDFGGRPLRVVTSRRA